MSRFNLRKKPRICYYEPDDPNLDEYIFCDQCADYVYEYCAIHGPLLVIPDDKVPTKTNFPAFVPRAALTIPHVFLHIAPSTIPGAGLGVFSTLTLPRGVSFGPYRGQRTKEVTSMYCWQIYDRNNKPSHVVSAKDSGRSNWMRYVNCSRHWQEQNLLAYQYQGQLYYSEFANYLKINLGKYNSPPGFARKYGVPTQSPRRKQETVVTEASQGKTEKESKPIDTIKTNTIPVVDKKEIHTASKKVSSKVAKKRTFKTPLIKDSEKKKKIVNILDTSLLSDDNTKTVISNIIGSKNNIYTPLEDISNNILIRCSECPHTDVDKKSIDRHMRFHDKQRKFVCKICGYRFSTNHNVISHELRKHNIMPISTKALTCDICDYKCNRQGHLKTHIMTHTGVKPFSCDKCDYKCNQQCNLKTHIMTHTGVKPFACDICDYKCNQQGHLKTHIMTHTGVKPFACDICDYKCSRRDVLKTHIMTHTGVKPFACDICDYKCIEQSNLKKHIMTHTDVKPFACDICDYKCKLQSHLKTHIMTHTDVKPFACDICDYKCKLQGSLDRHIMTHTGVKPFACDICDYKCNQRSNLKKHIMTHTGVKPFACDICDYKCRRKNVLQKHLLTHL